jgi:hypothetical protein
MMTRNRTALSIALLMLAACPAVTEAQQTAPDMDAIAREYLYLELSMGLHDESHVDAYFGPAEIEEQADSDKLPLAEIDARAEALADSLATAVADQARVTGLTQRLQALRTRIRLSQGETLPFDEKALALGRHPGCRRSPAPATKIEPSSA